MEDPLLPLPPTTTTSNESPSILLRLAFLIFIAFAALFANHEASKSFDIIVADTPTNDSPSARCFRLSFVSNGQAARIMLDATKHINKILQLHPHPVKPIRRVTLQLATHNLTRPVTVSLVSGSDEEYVMSLDPRLLLGKDVRNGVEMAIRLGMAKVSLWDAPIELVNAVAEAVGSVAEDMTSEVMGMDQVI